MGGWNGMEGFWDFLLLLQKCTVALETPHPLPPPMSRGDAVPQAAPSFPIVGGLRAPSLPANPRCLSLRLSPKHATAASLHATLVLLHSNIAPSSTPYSTDLCPVCLVIDVERGCFGAPVTYVGIEDFYCNQRLVLSGAHTERCQPHLLPPYPQSHQGLIARLLTAAILATGTGSEQFSKGL